MTEPTMRLDRFLWFARLTRSRSTAQTIAEAGTLRIDGRRIDRSHAPVRAGCIIAFPQQGRVRVLRVAALPTRRGPPAEAAALYEELSTGSAKAIDAAESRA
ncbi:MULTISPECIES: RNA-binding S4 domain-containing protein [unclassified Sphingomonas]|uniref:RNA-binding S4 domain-containing protein n=1 Tax=unclassified Sphingomonas TaxID=196159 RepID=UPI00082CE13E|nr:MULTISPECIES: S4 domain-containing protein [unclassified Sphingomonas]